MRRSIWTLVLGTMLVSLAPAAQAQQAATAAAAAPTYFVLRLIAPRATFAQDMNPAETQVMNEHAAYWMAAVKQGRVAVFGPVLDPKGVWGLGVLKAKDEAEVKAFTAQDPAIKSGIGLKYEVAPMAMAVVGQVQ